VSEYFPYNIQSIPEKAIRTITAATSRISTEFITPIEHFTYKEVQQKTDR